MNSAAEVATIVSNAETVIVAPPLTQAGWQAGKQAGGQGGGAEALAVTATVVNFEGAPAAAPRNMTVVARTREAIGSLVYTRRT